MRLLNKPGTASSNRGGWMMIATILIEAWDLYAISFLLIFIKNEYNPTAAQLGLATAAVQGGALIGASMGILGMEERVSLLGGRFEIFSQVGKGTEVRAFIPERPAVPAARAS